MDHPAPPKTEPPKTEPPKTDPPKTDPAKTDPPIVAPRRETAASSPASLRAKGGKAPGDEELAQLLPVMAFRGILVPCWPSLLTGVIHEKLLSGGYEHGEIEALQAMARRGDRVLDLGAGLGITAALAERITGAPVTAVEANPALIPRIEALFSLNRTSGRVRHGVVSQTPGIGQTFYLRAPFWSSSLAPERYGHYATTTVPSLVLSDILAADRPSILMCDIEGGEHALLMGAPLPGIRCIIMELHHRQMGPARTGELLDHLEALGFGPPPAYTPKPGIRVFLRPDPAPGLRDRLRSWLSPRDGTA